MVNTLNMEGTLQFMCVFFLIMILFIYPVMVT